MAKEARKTTNAEDEAKAVITVVAKQDTRMRAGLQFTKEPREVEVTEAQCKEIAGDPQLAIIGEPRPAKVEDKS